MSMQDFYRGVEENIARYGRTVICVFGHETPIPFTYTIGETLKGFPELLVVAPVNPVTVRDLVNSLCELVEGRGRAFNDGEVVHLAGANLPVMVASAAPAVRSTFTIQAGEYLRRRDYPVQQVILPDPKGRFPGDPRCEIPYRDFPVFTGDDDVAAYLAGRPSTWTKH